MNLCNNLLSGELININLFQVKPSRTVTIYSDCGGGGDHLVVLKALLVAFSPPGTDLKFTAKWSQGRLESYYYIGLASHWPDVVQIVGNKQSKVIYMDTCHYFQIYTFLQFTDVEISRKSIRFGPCLTRCLFVYKGDFMT